MSSGFKNKYAMFMESLGTRVRAARDSDGVTQEELAEAAGVAVPTMSRIERDKQMPSALILWKIARRLGRSMDWFMEGSEPEVDPLERELAKVGISLFDIERYNPNLPREAVEGMASDGKLDWLRSIAQPPVYKPGESKARIARRRKKTLPKK